LPLERQASKGRKSASKTTVLPIQEPPEEKQPIVMDPQLPSISPDKRKSASKTTVLQIQENPEEKQPIVIDPQLPGLLPDKVAAAEREEYAGRMGRLFGIK